MKHALNILLVTAAFAATAFAQECSKNSDACKSTPASRSPFLEAAAKAEAGTRKPAPKTAKKSAGTAAPVQASTAAASAAPAAAPVTASPETFSNPLWLIFALGGLAGLYAYLTAGKKGRKK